MYAGSQPLSLRFFRHPLICVPPTGQPSAPNHQPAHFIDTFHLDFLHHLCQELQAKNKGTPIIESLVSPKILVTDGWKEIGRPEFEAARKQKWLQVPIAVLMPVHGPLTQQTSTIEFTVLFNHEGCARVFIGFVSPLLQVVDVIRELAHHFKIPYIEECYGTSYQEDGPGGRFPLSIFKGVNIEDMPGKFLVIDAVEDVLSKQQGSSLIDQIDDMLFITPIEGNNASTGIIDFNPILQDENRFHIRLLSQKKRQEVESLKQAGRLCMTGPLIPVPTHSQNALQCHYIDIQYPLGQNPMNPQ